MLSRMSPSPPIAEVTSSAPSLPRLPSFRSSSLPSSLLTNWRVLPIFLYSCARGQSQPSSGLHSQPFPTHALMCIAHLPVYSRGHSQPSSPFVHSSSTLNLFLYSCFWRPSPLSSVVLHSSSLPTFLSTLEGTPNLLLNSFTRVHSQSSPLLRDPRPYRPCSPHCTLPSSSYLKPSALLMHSTPLMTFF